MLNKYFELSSKAFGVISFFASFASQNFKCIAAVSLMLAICYYFIWSGDEEGYVHLKSRPFLSFNAKGEVLYNIGWIGLFSVTVLLIDRFIIHY